MRRSMAMPERVAMVISKPSSTRNTPEIDVLLPWLRKRSDLLRNLERKVLIDVLRACVCRRAIADDVILRQGEKGDELFVILSGSVGVFVDANKTGENTAPERPAPILHMHDLKQQLRTDSARGTTKPKPPGPVPRTPKPPVPPTNNGITDQRPSATSSISQSQQLKDSIKDSNLSPNALDSSNNATASSQNAAPHGNHLEPEAEIQSLKANSSLSKQATSSFHAEPADGLEPTEDEEILEDIVVQRKRFVKLDRSKYGKWVVKFGVGQCFGELALINADSVRNATIIADEDCIFMVINRDVFNKTLKSYQEAEYSERKEFVATNPLFRGWNAKFKKLLEMSIVKEVHTFNTTLLKQGDAFRGLLFIKSGRAKLHVEPDLHKKQYPERYPFKTENDLYELELIQNPKRAKKTSEESPRNAARASYVETEQVHVRRTQGYAAAEKRITTRSIPLCIIEEGEVIGDIELANNLSSYMHTVTCASNTIIYVLTPKNFERLINSKNNRSTLQKLRRQVETKLQNRVDSQQGAQVPLLKHLLFKMSEEVQPKHTSIPPLRGTKELPDRDVLFQHLVEVFKKNRAELIEPHVPGAIYYREMMRERARVRENHARQRKKKSKAEAQAELYSIKRRQRKKRHQTTKVARSSKALVEAMEKQKETEEEMHRRIISHALRVREEEEVRLMHEEELAIMAEQIASQLEEESAQEVETTTTNNRLGSIRETTEPEPQPQKRTSGSTPDALSRKASMILERIKTFLSEVDATSDPGGDRGHSPAMLSREHTKRPESAGEQLQTRLESDPDPDTLPEYSQSMANALEAERYLNISDDSVGESMQPTLSNTPVLSHSLDPHKQSVSPTSPKFTHVSQSLPLRPKKDKLRVQFVQSLLKKGPSEVQENPSYRDWETSDKSLSYLEEKVRDFAQRQSTEKVVGLPKLRRFERVEEDEELRQPIPGGRVLVQRKVCAATGKYALNNHSHVHYRVIPYLQNAEQLRRQKMLMQLLTDDARAQGN